MTDELKKYFSRMGRKGGKIVSAAKIAACRANAKLPRKSRPAKKAA